MKTINSFRSKLFALTCALMASVSSFAYDEMPDFQVDGLYYNFLEGDNVEVTHPYRPEMPTEGTSTTATQDLYDDYAELTELTIPSTISYEGKVYNVIRIGYAAFDQCNLTYVDIPSSIKTIGVGAFSNCSSLTSITLKEGLEHIEGNAFADCRLLETITFPNSLKTVGSYAFSFTAWYNNQPNGGVYAGNVFYKYKGDIPENTSFVIKEGTVSISPDAFIKENRRIDYGLVAVAIPNSVEIIGEYAFSQCRALRSVNIPSRVTTIESYAFSYCKSLTSVTSEIVEPLSLPSDVFFNASVANATLYVPAESVEAYKNADQWKNFGQILPIAENPEDLFPTLTGLQRTEVKVHTTGTDAPHIVSFDEYTHYVPYNKQRIYLTNDGLTFLREENNQVLLYAPSYGIKEDVVLYDWTLEVGDTLPYNKYTLLKEADFIVTNVSTITLLDGKEYKKWTLACGIEYIEGIGAINGGGYGNYFCLQCSESPAIYIENRLVCASRNGKLLYQMDDTEMERLGAECLCDVEKKWTDTWCDTWNVLEHDRQYSGSGNYNEQTWRHYLAQDTIINGQTYTSVNCYWTLEESKVYRIALVRFTEDKKVYLLSGNQEQLVYDFSVEVGDTIETIVGAFYGNVRQQLVVHQVDIDDATNRKTITLYPLCKLEEDFDCDQCDENGYYLSECCPVQWIEGVGSTDGFLMGDLPCSDWVGGVGYKLLCAYKNDQLQYISKLYQGDYGCEYNAAEQNAADLFPTLWGLQRTEVEYHTDGADAPSLVSFEEYTPTFVNGKWYLYDGMNYLREENNQVLLYSPHFEIYKDIVLYDWTLEVGDTLPYYFDKSAYKGAYYVVTNVSTITLLDGKEYKKWTLACGIEYIEGIGAINGEGYGHYLCLQHWDHPATYIGNRLVCASKNGKLLYQMDDTEMERLGAECLCEVEKKWSDTWCDTWNVLELKYRYSSYTTKEDFETWRYYLAQDTIINNYTYTAVTRQTTKVPEGVYPFTIPEPEYVAAVRFTDDRKVYIYYDNTEYLLYDFNVQPGDELTVFAGINHYHSHHTNTIRVDEVERYPGIYPFGTEISLSVFPDFSGDVRPTCFGVTKWVEGVGDLCGFITGADCGLSEYQTALLCAYKDGNTEYRTEYEEYTEYGCEYNSGENKEYILTLPGLQRTGCTKTIGENENGTVWGSRSYLMQEIETATIDGKQYLLFGIDNNYDKLYLKLWLREENNKILLYSTAQKKDLVLYDFTLNVGDSLPRLYVDYDLSSVVDYDNDEWGLSPLIVTEVSTITLLDGKEYKKWTFDNGMQYVEGIGSFGTCYAHNDFYQLIANAPLSSDVYSQYLVCVSKNNKLLYQMDDAEMERLGAECLCDYDRGPLKDNAKNGKIGGRPTPTQWNQLELDLREMENGNTILRAETFSYTLENDSIVANGKTYYQLARQSTKDTATTKSVVGALHFGKDEDNRVYFLRDGVEYVLYDFTAEPGDTVEIFAGINNYPQETTYTHVVTGKDTLENGACRMLLEVVFPDDTNTTAENAEKVWLAGLGSVDGIVHNAAKRASNAHAAPSRSADSNETESSVMLCAWREDSCLYTTDHPDYDSFGCVYNQDPTSIEDTHSPLPMTNCQKIIRNEQLLILHEGKIYNVLGVQIK